MRKIDDTNLLITYWDGKSFFSLDFSLHEEKDKNQKKPYGLTTKQRNKQYSNSKQREKNSCCTIREKELTVDKISMAIAMAKRGFKQKLDVNYLLMNSWFFCEAFLNAALELGTNIIAWQKWANPNTTTRVRIIQQKSWCNL